MTPTQCVSSYTVTRSDLAVTIRTCRRTAGLTLDHAARLAGVSRSTVAKIEAGSTPDPGFSVVARLLAACGAQDEMVLQLHQRVAKPTDQPIGIGYEGHDQASLVATLREQHVQVVADVRLNPISRKAGLSKTALSKALRAGGIDYVHLRGLGNPKTNRPGYGDVNDLAPRQVFERLLQQPEAVADLERLRSLAKGQRVALLCFEKDERLCHREQVLDALC